MSLATRMPSRSREGGLVLISAALLAAFAALALAGFVFSDVLVGELAYLPLVVSAVLMLVSNVREARATTARAA